MIAASTKVGPGPFSQAISVLTPEDGKKLQLSCISNITIIIIVNLQYIHMEWSLAAIMHTHVASLRVGL